MSFSGHLKTRTLAFTQQISRTPTVCDGWLHGCCERNEVRARGRAPYQDRYLGSLSLLITKGDSALKQGLLFLSLLRVYVGGGLSQTANSDVDRSKVLKCSSRVNIDEARWRTLSMRQCVVPVPALEMQAGPVTADGDGR